MPCDLNCEFVEQLLEGFYFVDKNRKILVWNKQAEKITGFKAENVIGRYCYDNILNHIDENGNSLCFGGCPLHKTNQDGIIRDAQVYLQHEDGHRIPVAIRVVPIKENGEIIGSVEIFDTVNRANMDELNEYKNLALYDHLTELYNRRYMQKVLDYHFTQFQNFGKKFAVAFIDADDFKKVNDNYGHDVGDLILKMISKTISNSVDKNEVIARWGGEEFLILMNEDTTENLNSKAEKIRMLVENSKVNASEMEVQVTISIGITVVRNDDTIDSLVKRADKLMYLSKKKGKNCYSID